MSIEAAKQALEALYLANTRQWPENKIGAAINALSAAIAEAESVEPRCAVIVEVFGTDWRLDYMSLPVGKHKLYTQEYVYTNQPAAQWVGLTDEEAMQTFEGIVKYAPGDTRLKDFARAIEAKLKEKNT